MSRFTKRTWSEQGEENGLVNQSERMKADSRENSSSRKRSKPNSDVKTSKTPKKPVELETDPTILQRRQKQIDYGKNTVGYHNYTQQVPVDQRTKEHPKTPEKFTKYSRRSWDTLIKIWRKKLHEYDTDSIDGDDTGDTEVVDVQIVDDDIVVEEEDIDDEGLSYHSGRDSDEAKTSETDLVLKNE